MENELFFIYDYKTHNFKINNFIDNEIHNIIDMDISELTSKMEDEHLISDDTIDEYNAFVADMKKARFHILTDLRQICLQRKLSMT